MPSRRKARFDKDGSSRHLGVMRRSAGRRVVVATAILALGFEGCAAIPLAVIAGSLLEAGGSVIVKTGTEYTASGAAHRTFTVPAGQVHAGVLEAFSRVQIAVVRDQASAKRHRVDGRMQGRTVRVELLPLTPTLTALTLDVRRNILAGDKATASELLAQIERVVIDDIVATPAPPAPSPCQPVRRVTRAR